MGALGFTPRLIYTITAMDDLAPQPAKIRPTPLNLVCKRYIGAS